MAGAAARRGRARRRGETKCGGGTTTADCGADAPTRQKCKTRFFFQKKKSPHSCSFSSSLQRVPCYDAAPIATCCASASAAAARAVGVEPLFLPQSGRPACCRAQNGQPRSCCRAEQGTGLFFGRWAEVVWCVGGVLAMVAG